MRSRKRGPGISDRSKSQESSSIPALHEISFRLEAGSSLGIIGTNGSGKSTLLKVLGGVMSPTTGEVLTEGRLSTILGLAAGTMPQLSGWDNVLLLGRLLGQSKRSTRKAAAAAAEFSGLGPALHWPVRTYSSGMLLRLGFSAAVHLLDSDILLVDEIIAVGDLVFQRKCMAKMQELRSKEGRIVVIATHNLGNVGALCDRIMLLEKGRVALEGDTEEVLRHYWRDCERAMSRIEGFRNPFEPPQVYGEDLGTVRIERVVFLDGEGNQSDSFNSGEPLTVCIDYIAHKAVRNPLFRVQFHRSDGVLVQGMNTYRKGTPGSTDIWEGRGRLTLHYPAFRLLQGDYYISIGVWPDEYRSMLINQAFDFHERAYMISVDSRIDQGAGVVFQEAEWSWESLEGETKKQ